MYISNWHELHICKIRLDQNYTGEKIKLVKLAQKQDMSAYVSSEDGNCTKEKINLV